MTDLEFYNLYFGKWNFCGCGDPAEAITYIRDVLACLKERSDSKWKINRLDEVMACEGGPYWIIMYWLDSQGFTEHGSNVGGSWLTQKGEEFLAYLVQGTFEAVLNGEFEIDNNDFTPNDAVVIYELERDNQCLRERVAHLEQELAEKTRS